jgi:RNA polymerase sigma factor (sigma-70 family)
MTARERSDEVGAAVGAVVGAVVATAAFEEVYARLYDRMVRLDLLASAEPVPAEEIVQDAFVQLYRRWDDVAEPAGYLRVAVLNGCRSWGRRRTLERRQPTVAPAEVTVSADGLAVRQALRVLTDRQRAAVVLRYFEDLPEAEIARLMGCRPGTVKSLPVTEPRQAQRSAR